MIWITLNDFDKSSDSIKKRNASHRKLSRLAFDVKQEAYIKLPANLALSFINVGRKKKKISSKSSTGWDVAFVAVSTNDVTVMDITEVITTNNMALRAFPISLIAVMLQILDRQRWWHSGITTCLEDCNSSWVGGGWSNDDECSNARRCKSETRKRWIFSNCICGRRRMLWEDWIGRSLNSTF